MIIEKARELGIALSQTPEFQRMLKARTALDNSETVSKMLSEYKADQERLMHILDSDDVVNNAEAKILSDNMDRLQASMMGLDLFTEVVEAQNEFQQLLGRVNRTIGLCIGTEEPEYIEDSCGGSCDDCGGGKCGGCSACH